MKRLLIAIIVFLALPLVFALPECQRIMEFEPCLVISSYPYASSCASFNASVFNESACLVNTYPLGVYGNTGLCNFTWNISQPGFYTYNISSGDSGAIRLTSPRESMAGISSAIILFVMAFLWLGVIAIGMMFKNIGFSGLGFVIGVVLGFLLISVSPFLTAAMVFINAALFFYSARKR